MEYYKIIMNILKKEYAESCLIQDEHEGRCDF
jgi:hypothetical protein